MALRARAVAQRAEREHPPIGRFVQAGGVRLHIAEWGAAAGGAGPPIVLLHGNGSMVEEFATSGLIEILVARGHRVLAIDRPGSGHSDRPRDRAWTPQAQAAAVAEALAPLGVGRTPPVVVGHSWGALAALAMALDRPEAVGGLVLVSGFYRPVFRPDAAAYSTLAVPVLGDAVRYVLWPPIARLLAPLLIARIFAPNPVPPRFAAGFPLPMALRPSQQRAVAEETGQMVPAAAALARRHGELRLPVAIVAGTEDRMVGTRRHAVWLHRRLPGSTLMLVPGQGHMVHHGRPDRVADAIDAVAAAVEARAARPGR